MSAPLPPKTPFIKSSGISGLLGAGASSALTAGFGPIGAFAAPIASQLIGGLFGNKGPSFQQQINDARTAQDKHIRGQIASTVRGAKENKIHPLAALGISPNASPVGGNYNTGDIQGQNLGRAVGAGIAGAKEAQLANLAIERAGLENDLLRSQITNVNNQAGDPPAVAETQTERDLATPSKQRGVRDGIEQMLVKVRDNTGGFTYTWNDKAGENEVMQAVTALMITLPHSAINNIDYIVQKYYGFRLDQKAKLRLKAAAKRADQKLKIQKLKKTKSNFPGYKTKY